MVRMASVMWKSARIAGLAALGVSMALAPGLSAQSLARSAGQVKSAHRSGVVSALPSAARARVDITADRVTRSLLP